MEPLFLYTAIPSSNPGSVDICCMSFPTSFPVSELSTSELRPPWPQNLKKKKLLTIYFILFINYLLAIFYGDPYFKMVPLNLKYHKICDMGVL